jgi:hypothetical protein
VELGKACLCVRVCVRACVCSVLCAARVWQPRPGLVTVLTHTGCSPPAHRHAQKPLEALQTNLDASIALLKASLADTRAAAAASKAAASAAAAARRSSSSRRPVTGSYSGGAALRDSGSARPADAPKADTGKHIMRYTCEEVGGATAA